jgi:hypothetical protein
VNALVSSAANCSASSSASFSTSLLVPFIAMVPGVGLWDAKPSHRSRYSNTVGNNSIPSKCCSKDAEERNRGL